MLPLISKFVGVFRMEVYVGWFPLIALPRGAKFASRFLPDFPFRGVGFGCVSGCGWFELRKGCAWFPLKMDTVR